MNVLLRSTKIDEMGGLPKQAYYDGIHEIADDEALIVETALPEHSRYWQILVADDRFATVDWVNRQSSLNDAQARIDSDGKFRVVISKRDPGVPNWLDKADFPWGIIQMRFNRASDLPEATVIEGSGRRGARTPARRHADRHAARTQGAAPHPARGRATAADLVNRDPLEQGILRALGA